MITNLELKSCLLVIKQSNTNQITMFSHRGDNFKEAAQIIILKAKLDDIPNTDILFPEKKAPAAHLITLLLIQLLSMIFQHKSFAINNIPNQISCCQPYFTTKH